MTDALIDRALGYAAVLVEDSVDMSIADTLSALVSRLKAAEAVCEMATWIDADCGSERWLAFNDAVDSWCAAKKECQP